MAKFRWFDEMTAVEKANFFVGEPGKIIFLSKDGPRVLDGVKPPETGPVVTAPTQKRKFCLEDE